MKFLITILLFLPLLLQAEEGTDYSRLPDKTFLHLDRNLYSQGDTIWAKAYAFHRNNNALSHTSYALHIQMLSEEGQEVGNYKMLMIDGMGFGQIPVYDSMKPGIYQLIAHTGHMKNFRMNFFHRSKIEVRAKDSKSSIKAFFDKESYRLGDTAKVSFYAYDEFHIPEGKKRFRYAMLHNEETLDKGGLRCFEDGSLTKRFPITEGSKKNPSVLELSFYDGEDLDRLITQRHPIPMEDDDVFVAFYPESGLLIKGMDCKIAFEATDAQGMPVEVKGEVLEDGVPILDLASFHYGKGIFSLKARDAKYAFRVTAPQGVDSVFQLPEPVDQGFNLSYLRQNKKNLYLIISQNIAPERELSLWVSQYDQLKKAYDFKVGARRLFVLPKTELPSGIVTFTVVDNMRPVVERLVYLQKEESALAMTTDESRYGTRKKVTVHLALEDTTAQAHLSLAVVDSVLGTSPWFESDNIRAYTLLRSELKGAIPDINTYLEDTPEAELNRNLLLMTHGWRKFDWIRNQQLLDTMQIASFNSIRGSVSRRRKPLANAKMTAMVMGGGFDFAEFSTDREGRFIVNPDYQTRASANILFQARTNDNRKNVKIKLENTDTLLFSAVRAVYSQELLPIVHKKNLLIEEDDAEEDQEPFLSYETKLLKEVVVYGEHYDPDEELKFSESSTAFATGAKTGEELMDGYSFVDFVRQVSLKAEYDPSNDCIIVRDPGGSSIMFDSEESDPEEIGAQIYVNDMPWGTDVSALDFLTKEDIVQLVVYDPRSAYPLYGSEAAYGVILVRVRESQAQERSMDRNMAVFGRFIKSKDFITQRYETKQQDSLVVVDNRITLHWEPFVEIDSLGRAEVEFYTDDISGTKQIVVQGLDEDGNLYYKTQGFEVRGIGQ